MDTLTEWLAEKAGMRSAVTGNNPTAGRPVRKTQEFLPDEIAIKDDRRRFGPVRARSGELLKAARDQIEAAQGDRMCGMAAEIPGFSITA